MANYLKATDFAAKDALLTGDPNKIVKGTEYNDEFNAIQTAINSKANLESPTFTGTPKASTAALNTNTIQIATTAFVANALGALTSDTGSLGLQSADNVAISGGTITGITDLTIADGGTGASTATDARTNLGVPSLTGTGTSGTWPISITGSAGSISTSVVNAAIAASAVGAVGTYALLYKFSGSSFPGTTYSAGSSLFYGGVYTDSNGSISLGTSTSTSGTHPLPSGTWRAMGWGSSTSGGISFANGVTLYLRIV